MVPAIQLVTMAITTISAYFVSRQQVRTYRYTRNFLVLVHVFFLGVVILEFLRNFFSSPSFVVVYTDGATTFILSDVVLLTLMAASFYYRASALGGGSPLSGLLKRRWHALAFASYMIYIALVEAYLLLYQPFIAEPLTNIAGVTLAATVFDMGYVNLLFVVLVVFILYPSMLLLFSRRRVADRRVKSALLILPVCWSAIGMEFLIFNGYLLIQGIDASSLGYLVGAAVFIVTARIFRQATTFSSLFSAISPGVTTVPVPQFSSRLGMSLGFTEGRLFLMEPSSETNYEQSVRDFVLETVSTGGSAFVFTSMGSPVYNAVSKQAAVRIYILSPGVSYPKETEKHDEFLVPSGDVPVLLDLISKIVSANVGVKITVVYDSLTDMILSRGLQECYRLVKQANAMLSAPNVSSLFLLTFGAHDEKTVSLMKGLFPNHLVLDQTGLRITRSADRISS